MHSPRSCPHCKCVIPLDYGYEFDSNLNITCLHCGKIAFLSGLQVDHHEAVTPENVQPLQQDTI